MGKNSPSHQHFIPRAYLRKFAKSIPPKKRFLDLLDIASGTIKPLISVADICVRDNLYTLKVEGVDKYKLETYYATHVDDVYPEVYELLIDSSKTVISGHQRRKMLNTLLSLYFRAPKVLNRVNKLTDESIDRAIRLSDPGEEYIHLSIEDRKYNFHRDQVVEVKKAERAINHRGFLISHLGLWHDFVSYKYNCGIMVYEIEGSVDLITSDFPVIVSGPRTERFHLFNPANIIQIPLDRRHYVMIAPNTEEVLRNRIFRSIGDEIFALTINYQIHNHADRQLFGFPETINKHVADQARYGEQTDENEKIVTDMQSRVQHIKELFVTMETFGPFSVQTAQHIRRLLETNLLKEDKELLKLRKDLNIQ